MKFKYAPSLGLRIFAVFTLIIAIVIGAVIGFSYNLGGNVANESAQKSLDQSLMVQSYLLRSGENEIALKVSSFASDPNFVSYIDDAVNTETGIDLGSIFDLVSERKQDTGLDFIIVTDDEMELIVHSEKPGLRNKNYIDNPLTQGTYEELIPSAGFWLEDGALYQAVVSPLDINFELVGFVIVGQRVGENMARAISGVGGSDIVFAIANDQRDYQPAVSTLPPKDSAAVLKSASFAMNSWQDFDVNQRLTFYVGNEEYAIEVSPLTPYVDGDEQALMWVVSSVDKFKASYKKILDMMLLGGLLALFLALPLSYLVSRQVLVPVRGLTERAEAAAQGDYGKSIAVSGRDELARLSQAFDRLLSDLRDKLDMQAFMASVYSGLNEEGGVAEDTVDSRTLVSQSRATNLTLLAVEFSSKGKVYENDARAFAELAASASEVVEEMGGCVVSGSFGVLLIAFEGEERLAKAYASAVQIFRDFDASEYTSAIAIKLALSDGDVNFSPFNTAAGTQAFVAGASVRQPLALLREADSGVLLASTKAYQGLKNLLASQGIQPVLVEGRVSKKRLCSLPLTFELLIQPIDDDQTIAVDTSVTTSSKSRPLAKNLPSRYRVLNELGKGAMGVVYRAIDQDLNSVIAIKILRGDVGLTSENLENIRSEISLARQITHQNILRTFDFGENKNMLFITMEYVRGMTLDQLIRSTGKLPYSAGLKVAKQLCAGLAAVHGAGVIHRDIKASNVIIEPNGNLKLMDFGIAFQGKKGEDFEGLFVGTVEYASPEQCLGEILDSRSDIYSLGILLIEIFTGQKPYEAKGFNAISAAHVNGELTSLIKLWPQMPDALLTLLNKCIALEKASRYASAEEVLVELNKLKA